MRNNEIANEKDQRKLAVVLEGSDPLKKRTISRAVIGKISNWLTVIPTACNQLGLSALEFHDALALHCIDIPS